MKYRYKKYQIFRKKLDVSQEVLDHVYNNKISFEEYINYELEDKIPVTCLKANDYELVTFFGLEKAKLLDWKLIHSNDNVRDTLLTLDPKEPDINRLLYQQVVDRIDPRMYSSEMKKQYPDRILDAGFDAEFTERFYQGKLTVTEIVDNWSILKDKYLDKSLESLNFDGDQMKSFMIEHPALLELFGIDQFTDTMKSVLSTKTSHEEQNKAISDFVFNYTKEHGLTKENSSLIFKYIPMKEYTQRRIGEENTERLYSGLNGTPEEYLLDLPISFDQLLDSPGLNFINYYGVKNVFDFDRECGFAFTKNDGKVLETFNDYLKNASRNLAPHCTFYTRNIVDDTGNQIDRPYTKEEFYEAIRRMVIYGPELVNKKIDQREFTGTFRNQNPTLYVDETLPEAFQKKFYSQQITSLDLKEHSEYSSYLEGKSLEACISNIPLDIHSTNGVVNHHVNFVSFLNDKLDSKTTLDFLTEYSFVFGTDMGLKILSESRIESSDSLETMKTKIDDGIVEQLTQGQTPYSPDMPQSIKKRLPLYFLDDHFPKEIRDKFCEQKLDYVYIKEHPEYRNYFSEIGIERLYRDVIINKGEPNEVSLGTYMKQLCGETEGLDILSAYEYCIFENPTVRVDQFDTKENLLNELELKTYEAINNGSFIRYNHLSNRFKERFPLLFLPLDTPKELQTKFYNRNLTFEDFDRHPEWIDYFNSTEIMYGFNPEFIEIKNSLRFDNYKRTTENNIKKLELAKIYTKIDMFQQELFVMEVLSRGLATKESQYIKTWTWLINNKERIDRDGLSITDFKTHPELLNPKEVETLQNFDSNWTWLSRNEIARKSVDQKLQLVELYIKFKGPRFKWNTIVNDICFYIPEENMDQYAKILTWLINNKEKIDRDGLSITDFQKYPEILLSRSGGFALGALDEEWSWLPYLKVANRSADQKLQLIEIYMKVKRDQFQWGTILEDIFHKIPEENMDQYINALTWLSNNKERIDRDGLSITDFQNHPEFLDPNRGGRALQVFDKRWAWLNHDEIASVSADQKLQLLKFYTKLEDPTMQGIFVECISYGVPNENMDQYLETMTWLVKNRGKIEHDGLSITDFQNHPEFLDPNRGGRALQVFDKRWAWLNHDEITKQSNEKKLQLIELYSNLNNEMIKTVFADYIIEHHNSIDDKVKITLDRLDRLALSNSSELDRVLPELAKQILQLETAYMEKIENVFLKNNIPTVGKKFSVFQILHPELKDFSFSDNSSVSPILKSKSDRGREVVIFSDLMKTVLGSNNRSMRDYLNNIERGNQLFSGITSGMVTPDKLNKTDKTTLSIFAEHLNTLYQHTKVGGKNNHKVMLTGNAVSDIQQFIPLFSKDGSVDYNLPDRLISMFCHFAGFDTFQETKNYFIQKPNKADEKHRQFASQPFVLESGDFVKGINKIDYLPNILQNGSVAKEFLGNSADSDRTPLDTDLSRVITKQPTINESMNNLIANGYGPIWLVLKNDDRFVITREGTRETEKTDIDKSDLKKIEAFCTLGQDHYGIRTGFASSEIDAMITNSRDNRVGLEIAMNGFYIPVYDRMTEELVFSPKEYDTLREKMSGLSYFDTGEYHFAENLTSSDVKQLAEQIPFSKADVSKKRQAIHQAVEEAIKKVGLELNDGIDKDLSEGRVDLIDTGSTGRGTNMPGDGDFDFMLRLDKRIMVNSNNMNEIKEVLLDAFGEEHRQEVIGSGDFRLKKVKIDGLEEPVDIDMTFVEKMDQLDYSTDMALQDRLQTIEKQDPEKYPYVVANILLAKKVLSKYLAKKPQEPIQTSTHHR